jgi:hypothetical protein
MVRSQNKNMFCDVSFGPFPPLSYNLYTWKLKEANNGTIKNEALLIVPYETHEEHRNTSLPLEKNYTTLSLPMGHITNLLPKWWVTNSSLDEHPHYKLKVIIHHHTNYEGVQS